MRNAYLISCLLLFLSIISCSNNVGSSSENLDSPFKNGELEFFETFTNEELEEILIIIDNEIIETRLYPSYSATTGFAVPAQLKNTVDLIIKTSEVLDLLEPNAKFMWSYKPQFMRFMDYNEQQEGFYLYVVKVPDSGKARINSSHIEEAIADFDTYNYEPIINILFKEEFALEWEKMTEENINRSIAITMNDIVLTCPVVRERIEGGATHISGSFTRDETLELTNLINQSTVK